ncbi:hypothetical protein MIR68_008067 [Amoeboaphelidium protococcarum]|nr:hypothetical protein MIR68_008067 [Amoeboaphelidium protococcarum]
MNQTDELQDDALLSFNEVIDDLDGQEPGLDTVSHVKYCIRGMHNLSSSFVSLDASQPWLCYWILHSMELLHPEDDQWIQSNDLQSLIDGALAKLRNCYNVSSDGGFAGGPNQVSHLAPTYAAVCALVTIGTQEALDLIDRQKMYKFLQSLKQSDGSFVMHRGGEVDIRGSYCAIAVASLLNIMDEQLCRNVAEFVAQCQTYEGGIGGNVGNEAHGGYTYCGLATLSILQKLDSSTIDLTRLQRWLRHRQMPLEGGFQGRTNKLVDACYSYWQGASHAILLQRQKSNHSVMPVDVCNWIGVINWNLACAQIVPGGGFTDRYDRGPDYYHTCYALSGLSIANEQSSHDLQLSPLDPRYNISVRKLQQWNALLHQQ